MTRMNERQVSNLSAPTNPFGGAFAKRLLPMGLAAFLRGVVAPVAMVTAAGVPAMAADAPQPGNAQVAEAVAALRAIAALKADFVQSDLNGGSVRGTLYLKRPGKIRFQYQPGYPMTILSDGTPCS
jgi:outer membrane lipoprotein-sorting protein